jgi:hypothetical protein
VTTTLFPLWLTLNVFSDRLELENASEIAELIWSREAAFTWKLAPASRATSELITWPALVTATAEELFSRSVPPVIWLVIWLELPVNVMFERACD